MVSGISAKRLDEVVFSWQGSICWYWMVTPICHKKIYRFGQGYFEGHMVSTW